jgi:hypothetical protein
VRSILADDAERLNACGAHISAFFRQADRYPPVYTRFPQKSVDKCGFMHRICAKNNENCRNPRNYGQGARYTIQNCPAGPVIHSDSQVINKNAVDNPVIMWITLWKGYILEVFTNLFRKFAHQRRNL